MIGGGDSKEEVKGRSKMDEKVKFGASSAFPKPKIPGIKTPVASLSTNKKSTETYSSNTK